MKVTKEVEVNTPTIGWSVLTEVTCVECGEKIEVDFNRMKLLELNNLECNRCGSSKKTFLHREV